ncbi:tetratricopeptide repeat protein [Streptomyces sp. NBC_00503]|uniref:tetratricopeptide repeat protein n=1 Tax=Streptomyces sp. NBC_00503 TaxID=2903659 RepID=UPI003FCC2B0A
MRTDPRLLRTDAGQNDPQTLQAASNLALAHREAGDTNRSLPLLKTAYRAAKRTFGPGHVQFLTAGHNLAQAHHAAGDLAKAIRLYRKILFMCVPILGESDPLTISTQAHLVAAYVSNNRPAGWARPGPDGPFVGFGEGAPNQCSIRHPAELVNRRRRPSRHLRRPGRQQARPRIL